MFHWASLRELYLTRLREFYRQPARIFWVYGFPTIMAIGLGWAFRNRPPEPVDVVVVENAAAGPVRQALDTPAAKGGGPGRAGVRYIVLSGDEAYKKLRTGKATL